MNYDFNIENRRDSGGRIFRKILITVVEIAAVVFLAFAITHYGMETFTVAGQYMSPTLNDGDKILVNKISYRMHSIKRNDVVVVKQSGSEHNYYSIERVIALPGEKIQIKSGKVYIDGKELEEKYDFPVMENGGLALEEIALDEDEYFVLCDNRNNGEDSRNATVGNVLRENIVGKAWVRMNTFQFISHLDGFEEEKDSKKREASSGES